jgi:TPR repeat protein
MIGAMYERGVGLPRSIDEAIDWYKRAAAQGVESAKRALERLEVQSAD